LDLETIGAWLRAAPFCKGRRRAGSQFSMGPGEPGNVRSTRSRSMPTAPRPMPVRPTTTTPSPCSTTCGDSATPACAG